MKKIYKYLILVLILISNIIFPKNKDSLTVLSNNVESITYKTDKFYLTYDSWGVNGGFFNYGLPGYSLRNSYNGMETVAPLFRKQPLPWYNSDYTKIKSDQNSVQINSEFFETKSLHSEFSYFKGDYGYSYFSMRMGRKVSDSLYWTLYGKNFSSEGSKGLYGKNYQRKGESLGQSYHLDFYFNNASWKSKAGISYNKYYPGLMGYKELEYGVEETYLSLTHAGHLGQKEIRNYFITQHMGRDSTKLGVSFSNHYYKIKNIVFNHKYNLSATSINLNFQRNIRIGSKTFLVEYLPSFQDVTLENNEKEAKNFYRMNLSYKDSVFYGKTGLSLKLLNFNAGYDLFYKYKWDSSFSIELNTAKNYFEYPISYELGEFTKSNPKQNFGHYYKNNLNFNFKSKSFYLEQNFIHINSNYLYPKKEFITDSLTYLEKRNFSNLYFYHRSEVSLPAGLKIDTKMIYTPADSDRFINFYGRGRIQQNLTPVFGTIADIIPEYLGFFKSYFRKIQQNMIPYWTGEISYLQGGDRLIWLQSLQQGGASSIQYYTNNRLTVDLKMGFRVKSFHFFYSIYNLMDRKQSTIGGMPYRGRLKVYGIKWSFLD